MADRWGWQGGGRSPSTYSVFFSHRWNADTVQLGERSPYGCDFLSSSLFFLFLFSFFSSCFYSSKEGLPPPPSSSSSPPLTLPPQTCLPVSALVWGRGSSVIIFFWSKRACGRYVDLPCSGLVTQLRPQLWCSLSAEPALCLKCLGNYNVYEACECSVNHCPHHSQEAKGRRWLHLKGANGSSNLNQPNFQKGGKKSFLSFYKLDKGKTRSSRHVKTWI